MNPEPPTYPARPVNGGALDVALPKRGEWRAEPKYNGWRALVHVPTGTMFNRELQQLSIAYEFKHALGALKTKLPHIAWADCEALSRRHNYGKGALILLDVIHDGAGAYLSRRLTLYSTGIPILWLAEKPEPDALYIPPCYLDAWQVWNQGLEMNKDVFGTEFYEGVVMKRADSLYPMQKIKPSRETADWMKHRWRT